MNYRLNSQNLPVRTIFVNDPKIGILPNRCRGFVAEPQESIPDQKSHTLCPSQ